MSDLNNDIRKIVEDNGLLLYDIETVNEGKRTIFSISVFKNGGSVTMEECVELTNIISPLLDVKEPISGEYSLEIGSAGLERKLKKIEHFANSIDDMVKISLKDGANINGTIKGVENSTIILDDGKKSTRIEFDNISKAKTYIVV